VIKKPKIIVGMGTCGLAAGAQDIYAAAKNILKTKKIDSIIQKTGCIGMCHREVLFDVIMPGRARVSYGEVNEERLQIISDTHIQKGKPVAEFAIAQMKEYGRAYRGIPLYKDIKYNSKQVKIVLGNCGHIDPNSIEDYIEMNGYKALKKTLRIKPEKTIEIIKKSGLRGRGGAGFPTGLKWEFCRKAPGKPKYIICNADEGDPGAFMDRSILEGDPHSVLEGMLVAGYAIGSSKGYIYCRAEYPLAIRNLNIAISQMRKNGFIGKNILGTGFDFDIKIKEGAGAFVCGEETALIASIEGKRGMPRAKPPFPAQSGLWGKPTTINNVETLANVPKILLLGDKWYASYGTAKSKGTKVFALTGKIRNSGLIEVPMGIPLKEIIYNIGGGIIPASLSDIRVDYESLATVGSIVGSGGMVVLDESDCMVNIAQYFLQFTQSESCGKCTPCRIGTKRLLEILERITSGQGRVGDIELLETLSSDVKATSLCGLGQTAPNPVMSTIKYFREEYEAHITEKKCPSGVCNELLTFIILEEFCTGCGACRRACPSGAISGKPKELHTLDQDLCVKCGACFEACKFKAIGKA
jgi:NADH:ubiquinone oxidoreductase subunit F (NADH-binding)/(2Fe-2S) ferredoxin